MSRVVLLLVAIVAVFGVAVTATPGTATCTEFCNLAFSACNGTATQINVFPYTSVAGCMAVCPTWPLLTPNDATNTSGNSLACRYYHAGVASTSLASAQIHCQHTGPASQGGLCGYTCDGYCSMMTSPVVAASLGKAPYRDLKTCDDYCQKFFSANLLGTGQTAPVPIIAGNNVECRAYHVSVGLQTLDNAALQMAHFTHATAGSVLSTCTNASTSAFTAVVENYCDTNIAACGLSGAVPATGYYQSRTDCLNQASYLVRGDNDDGATDLTGFTNTNNTIDCRLFHSGMARAAENTATYCLHAGMNGKSNCGGSECESYCSFVAGVCTSANSNQQYSSMAQCMATCQQAIPATALEAPYPSGGNSLQCRFYHTGLATGYGATTVARQQHCLHAGPSGGATCGTYQENLCSLSIAACNGTNSQYSSYATCLSTLASISAVGNFNDTVGNSMQCRIYHATAALNGDATAKALHCPYTSLTGGGVCIGTVNSGMASAAPVFGMLLALIVAVFAAL